MRYPAAFILVAVLLTILVCGCQQQTTHDWAYSNNAPRGGGSPGLQLMPGTWPPAVHKTRGAMEESKDVDPSPPPTPKKPPRGTVLLSQRKHDLYKGFWPRTDHDLDELRDDAVFYDQDIMIPVYQVFDKAEQSKLRFVFGGQKTANTEFPWAAPAGLHASVNRKEIRFFSVPEPITWTTQVGGGIRWQFPVGTVFGELLLVTDTGGTDRTFEMRLRTKGTGGLWSMDVYRPFPTEQSFAQALSERGIKYVPRSSFREGREFVPASDANNARRQFFKQEAYTALLQPLPQEVVSELLETTEFKHTRKPWREIPGDSVHVYAPTAKGYNVVPDTYEATFVPVSTESCMRCHRDAGKIVDPPGQQRWRIRGDDNIITFHPFDTTSVETGIIRVDQRLVDAGLLRFRGN